MPNRIIRESCRTSPTLAQLSADAERLFWRLTTAADDHGRFESESDYLACACFPKLLKTYPAAKIERLLLELASTKPQPCLVLYQVGERRYGQFVNWPKHQRIRSEKSKYPAPTPDNLCGQSRTSADNCGQPHANVPVVGSRSRESRARVGSLPSSPPAAAARVPTAQTPFDRFWEAYPRKIGKQAAWRIWQRLNPDSGLLATMLRTIERAKQTEQWQEQGGRFIPHPSTWLNQGRWDDEPMVSPNAKPARVRAFEEKIVHG